MPRVISVVVSLSVLGSHCWPEAPTHRQYLAIPHQHVFLIEAQVEVFGTDRELELHDLREFLWNFYLVNYPKKTNDVVEFGRMSCEDIAMELIDRIRWGAQQYQWKIGCVTTRVYEDTHGNGAVVTDVPLH